MKDHIRDYATAAFRFYAKVGGRESYIKHLVEDMERNQEKSPGISNPTEHALVSKERIVESRTCEFMDLEAVEKTLSIIEMCHSGRDMKKAIEYVYFKDCWRDMKKGDIESRVHYAEIHIPASRAQIYRWLANCRMTFAEERGLRT